MPKDTVKLGLMPPLSGVVGIYGNEISHAAQIACQQVNENGGVLERSLELVIEDDHSLPESAVLAAEKLVDQRHCSAIIGNLLSNSRIAVAYRVAEPRKIPYLNFSFYEGSILSRYFFHFAALPNQQIDKMIPYMRENVGPRMYFAGNNYEWPRGSIHAGKIALEHVGGEVVGEEYCPIGVEIQDIERLLDHVEATAPDVFVPYFAGTDQVNLLTCFTARGLKKTIAVVMGHYDEVMASQLSPAIREGFYSSNTYFMSVDCAENRNYLARLAQHPEVTGIWPQGNGILTNFGEGTYICVKAFAEAANIAGSLDPEALVEALKSVSICAPQGLVEMNPEHHHARVNTYLSRCQADGRFEIIKSFGAIEPELPERYNHQRITHQATLEDDIRLQARMLEQMSDAIILVSTQDGSILYTNAGTEKLFGYNRNELIGLPIAQLNDPANDNPQETFAEISRVLNQHGKWQGEIRNVKKDGTPIWCAATVSTFTHPVYGEVWLAVHRDISAQKHAEQEMHREQDFANSLVKTAPVIILLLDTQGLINHVNPYFEKISGYHLDEIKGKEWFATFLPARDQDRIREIFHASVNTTPKRGNINPIVTRNGVERDIEWYDQVMRDPNGEITGLLAIGQDVTEQVLAEKSLLESENRFHTLARIAPVGIFQTDAQGKCIYVNETWLEFTGMELDQALGDRWGNALHPDDREQIFETWNKSVLNDKPFALEFRFQRADGTTIWVYGQSEAYRDETGKLLNYVGTITNIDQRKKAELEHIETQHRMRKQQSATLLFAQIQKSASENLPAVYRQLCETIANELDIERVSIWLLNESTDCLVCQDLYIASKNQHETGMALSNNNYPAYFNAIKSVRIFSANDACSHTSTRELTASYLKPNKISSMLDVPLRDGSGNVIGVLCHEHVGEPRHWHADEKIFATSIADMLSLSIELFARKQTENELHAYQGHLEKMVEERTHELENSNHELESFTYSVSHDLRTPLRGIDGFSHILLDQYAHLLDEQGRDYLQRVRNGAQRMGQLIDDMLQLSRASKEEITLQSVNLSTLAEQSVNELKQAEPARQIDIQITPDLQVTSDPKMMRMVLDNLLGNAWKFTGKCDQARIEFGLVQDADTLVYCVRDNGAGFDITYADKLFQVFQRLHRADEYPGTGIGLSIVARLIKRLGGRIWAESEPGKGASFYFTLNNKE